MILELITVKICWMDGEETARKMCSTCQRDDWGKEEMELGQPGRVSPCADVKLAIAQAGASFKRSGTRQGP